ncbi:hypothetical protein [Azospirillum sp. B4]|uniref:hypothetical protein n=1 Tax=Azospirillum sp. B4 TaxID=95605 RepID=UPI0003498EBC|nr:hypothetical protein [Azospirillum sp. B4]
MIGVFLYFLLISIAWHCTTTEQKNNALVALLSFLGPGGMMVLLGIASLYMGSIISPAGPDLSGAPDVVQADSPADAMGKALGYMMGAVSVKSFVVGRWISRIMIAVGVALILLRIARLGSRSQPSA